jgi:hypothetical protein
MKKHFKLTETTKVNKFGLILYQIQATRDLPLHGVKEGDLGGWVQKESNLNENAWVWGNAQV